MISMALLGQMVILDGLTLAPICIKDKRFTTMILLGKITGHAGRFDLLWGTGSRSDS
jgi:hypothetical protein